MRVRKVCRQCGGEGPVARSTDTLAGSGWRLEVGKDSAGRPEAGWLCPACWEKKTGRAPLQSDRSRRKA